MRQIRLTYYTLLHPLDFLCLSFSQLENLTLHSTSSERHIPDLTTVVQKKNVLLANPVLSFISIFIGYFEVN